MKNIIIIAFTIFSILTLFSCKKEQITHTIKGQMLRCINGLESPYLTNTAIDLFQQTGGSNYKSKVLANTTIDANGNFTFNYSTSNSLDKLMIRESSGYGFNPIITDIPLQNIFDLKVYYSARYNLVVNLNALKPYTNLDTLFVVKADSLITIKIPGPFTNRRLFNLNRFPVTPRMMYERNEQIQKANLNNTINLDKKYIVENTKLCGDTVYVDIDVK